ncbi:hypothetical protein Pta02_79350 [Planobispora takensis]|uniref:Uncharacterized protein n=1 Tax=Planobispora takensis TaxID=1367882 RepID=A0A8J3T4I0_9ACTN|nr:hypothetical protein Pta02_79350 [Planobispora takensis]
MNTTAADQRWISPVIETTPEAASVGNEAVSSRPSAPATSSTRAAALPAGSVPVRPYAVHRHPEASARVPRTIAQAVPSSSA